MKRELVELNQNAHANLKVRRNCSVERAAKQHLIGLKVTELAHAQTEFPVFFTRPERAESDESIPWNISAVTSLQANQNLFVHDGLWDAIYIPNAMRTYPMFLMRAGEGKEGFSVGIDPQSDAFADEGESLFEADGKASNYLSHVTAQLDADIKNEVLSFQFVQIMREMKLIRAVNLVIRFDDNSTHTLKGLHTIDEDKFHDLSEDAYNKLKQKGFLVPIYALLFSIYQVNGLVKRHNLIEGSQKVREVKVEVVQSAEPPANA